jgi:hypothetical protein
MYMVTTIVVLIKSTVVEASSSSFFLFFFFGGEPSGVPRGRLAAGSLVWGWRRSGTVRDDHVPFCGILVGDKSPRCQDLLPAYGSWEGFPLYI